MGMFGYRWVERLRDWWRSRSQGWHRRLVSVLISAVRDLDVIAVGGDPFNRALENTIDICFGSPLDSVVYVQTGTKSIGTNIVRLGVDILGTSYGMGHWGMGHHQSRNCTDHHLKESIECMNAFVSCRYSQEWTFHFSVCSRTNVDWLWSGRGFLYDCHQNWTQIKTLHLSYDWCSEIWVDFADAPTPIKMHRHVAIYEYILNKTIKLIRGHSGRVALTIAFLFQ